MADQNQGAGPIPQRPLGRTGVKVSALGLGGHHLGDCKTVEEAIRLVHEAVDAGITFYDNCWEYWNGRGADLAMQMLEESLRRLQTDRLDLWQVHGVCFDNEPERAYAKGGVLEAL